VNGVVADGQPEPQRSDANEKEPRAALRTCQEGLPFPEIDRRASARAEFACASPNHPLARGPLRG